MDKLHENNGKSLFENESISVSQLNKLAKTLLENNLPVFWIKGEISGLKSYNHIYFDLKDDGGKISCVVFARLLNSIDFTLENGQQIEVRGKVTIYPVNGSYQINIERIRQVGMGELWEAYHRLVNKLRNEGLFAPEAKKAIPIFPKSIGVITSKEGAVIKDVITTLRRRMPSIPIIVYHTAVQGSGAGMQIAKAIRSANCRAEVDVLIICRGGGSMEDLWCFNEEVVAREVFASHIPIISAIGHETDTTIIDFVADLRAATPTAAAELVVTSKIEWLNLINKLHYRLKNDFNYLLNDSKQQLDLYYAKLRLLNPLNILREKSNNVKNNQLRLRTSMKQLVNNYITMLNLYKSKLAQGKVNILPYQKQLKNLEDRLSRATTLLVQRKNQQLTNIYRHLDLVNPSNILARGYAIVKNRQGRVLYSSSDVKHNERIEVILKTDKLSAIVDKNYKVEQDELI